MKESVILSILFDIVCFACRGVREHIRVFLRKEGKNEEYERAYPRYEPAYAEHNGRGISAEEESGHIVTDRAFLNFAVGEYHKS